jgi:hypothetical protein
MKTVLDESFIQPGRSLERNGKPLAPKIAATMVFLRFEYDLECEP